MSGTTTRNASADWVTFDDLSIDGAGTGYVLAATTPGASVQSAPFDIGAPTPAKLRFRQQPAGAVAGASQNVVVELTDGQDHFILVDGVTVTLALDQNPGGSSLTPAAGTTTNGVVALPATLDKAASGYTLRATSAGLAAATSSAFAITPAAGSVLRFEPLAAQHLAADVFPVRVSVDDAFGNQSTSTALVSLSLTGPTGGSISGNTMVNAAAGSASFNVSVHQAATGYAFHAASSGLAPADSSSFDIQPDVAAKLAFTQVPPNGVINVPLSPAPVVQATDAFDNPTTIASGSVTLAVGPGAATVSNATKTLVGGVATFSNSSVNQPGTYSLSASSGMLMPATAPITIDPGPPTQVAVVSGPGSVVAGVAFSVTLELRDVNGFKTSSTAGVTAALLTNPGGDTLGGTLTRNATAGTVTFNNLVLSKATTGVQLTFTSSGLAPATVTLDVTPTAASKLAFIQQPTTTQAGIAIAPAVEVELRDPFDNRVPTDGASVTIALSVNPTSATLAGTTTATTAQGRASFANLSLAKAGTGYVLAASSGTLNAAISDAFDITPGPAVGLAFVPIPSPQDAGSPLAVVVNTVDSLGNVAPSTAAITVGLATNPTSDTLLGTATRNAVAGVATFDDLVLKKVAAGYTLAASASGLAGTTSNAFAIQPGPPAALRFGAIVSAKPAGFTGFLQAQVTDAADNALAVPGASVTFALGANPGSATLQGTLTVQTDAQGLAVCSDCHIDVAALGYTVTASATGLATGTSSAFDIVANSAHHIAFGTEPSDIVVNTPFPSTVTVRWVDYLGNPAVRDGDTVDLQLSAGLGQLSSTSGTTVNGVASFPGLTVDRPGSYWIVATILVSGVPYTAQSNTFVVSSGTPAKLQVTVSPSVVTACAQNLWRVEVQDAAGNRTNTNVPITVSTSMVVPGGTVSGTTTVVSSNGIADFTNLSFDRSGTWYQLLFASTGLASGSSGLITVLNGAPAKLAFTQQPTDTPAGVSIAPAPEVEVRDSCNNALTPDGTPIVLALGANPGGAALTGGGTGPTTAGRVAFPSVSLDRTGIGYTLSATSTGLTSATSSAFTITPAVPTRLVFAAQPGPATAGAAFPAVHVLVQDSLGNTATSSSAPVTVALSTNPTGDALAGTLTRTAASGDASFDDLVLTKASTGYALTASSAGLTSATATGVTVTAGAPAKLAFSTQPPTGVQLMSLPSSPVVAVQDAYGNQTTGTNTVSLALLNAGGATLGGPTSQPASAGFASFPGLSVSLPGSSYQLSASATGLASGSSNTFTVQPLSLVFTQVPANTQVGQAFQVQVELRTPTNALAPVSASVTLAMGNNPGGASLSGTLTQTAVNGVATFPGLSLNAAGSGYTIAATAAGMATAESSAITVASNVAQLAFTRLPAATPLDALFDVEVSAQDGMGALATTFTGTVTLALTTDPSGSATLSGTLTAAATGGKALFRNLSLNQNGTGFVLTASTAGVPDKPSAAFNVAMPAMTDGLGRVSLSTGAFETTCDGDGTSFFAAALVNARGVALDPVAHRLFVASAGDQTVRVYNLSASDDFTGVDRVADFVLGARDLRGGVVSGLPALAQFSTTVSGLAVDPTGRRLFVLDASRLLVFDLNALATNMSATFARATAAAGFSDVAYDDVTHRLYVSETANHRVLVYDATLATFNASTSPSFVLGQPNFTTYTSGTSATQLWSPQGLELDTANNRLFVADQGNYRVLGYALGSLANGMAASVVLGQGSFTTRTAGSGAAAMNLPVDVAIASGKLFVAETNNSRVTAFPLGSLSNGMAASNVLGRPTFTTGSGTSLGPASLTQPKGGLLGTGTRLFVSDGDASGRVLVYDVTSVTDGEDALDGLGHVQPPGAMDFARIGAGDAPNPLALMSPRAVAVDRTHGWAYVADTGNQRVLGFRLSATGDFAGQDRWADLVLGHSDFGAGSSGLSNPQSLALDEAGQRLFVGTGGGVQVFDLSTVTNGAAAMNTLGTGDAALAWDPARQLLFVGDASGQHVNVYDCTTITNGEAPVAVIGVGSTGTASDVGGVSGLAYDPTRQRLFVASAPWNRISVFDLTTVASNPAAAWVIGQPSFASWSAATSMSRLSAPSGLAVDPTAQRLYVTDVTNQRVMAFDLSVLATGMNASTYFGQATWTSATAGSDLGTRTCTAQGFNFGGSTPAGLVVDATASALWVAEPGTHRVGRFLLP